MSDHSGWVPVSRRQRCPICDKPDNCTISRDGQFVWCGRISDGSLKQNAGGQYLHRLGDERPRLPAILRPAKPARPTRDFVELAKRLAAHADEPRRILAESLGVDPPALRALEIGWDPAKLSWTIPERDADGSIIGIATRFITGKKKRLPGSKAGLTYAAGWDAGTGPILLVEGASDTAALMSVGLNVVGRPSNLGGVPLLIDLLYTLPDERRIIVIGERDQKESGLWPGRDGAAKTAERLADELDRPVEWALPPDDAKDSRAWRQGVPKSLPKELLAALFVSGLDCKTIEPPLLVPLTVDHSPAISITDWREWMLEVRIESIGRPGIYLDRSTTGAGKSTVDFQVICHFTSSGVA